MRLAKRGRALTNEEAIKKYLKKNGFVLVDPESLELKDQIAVFSSAKIVIGIMGASMTNTAFCAQNTDVIYLAPHGWMDGALLLGSSQCCKTKIPCNIWH